MKKFSEIIFAVAIINFFAFIIGTIVLAGDAVNGKSEGGRYYVANHGKLTEVSRAAFTYSRIHCYAVCITHPLAMIFGLMVNRQGKRERQSRKNPNVA